MHEAQISRRPESVGGGPLPITLWSVLGQAVSGGLPDNTQKTQINLNFR